MSRKRAGSIDALATAVAAGRTVLEASRALGISPATGYRWARGDDFEAAVNKLRGGALVAAGDRFTDLTGAALTVLAELLRAESPHVRLSAARTVVDSALRYRDAVGLEERVRALETATPGAGARG